MGLCDLLISFTTLAARTKLCTRLVVRASETARIATRRLLSRETALTGGWSDLVIVKEPLISHCRCEKCMRTKGEFKWRIMLQLNMADFSDNNWASCFQVISVMER